MVSWQQGEARSRPTTSSPPRWGPSRRWCWWSNRAVLYFEQGRLDAAIECLNRAIELDDDPVLRENRALGVFEQAGRLEEATRDREALQAA